MRLLIFGEQSSDVGSAQLDSERGGEKLLDEHTPVVPCCMHRSRSHAQTRPVPLTSRVPLRDAPRAVSMPPQGPERMVLFHNQTLALPHSTHQQPPRRPCSHLKDVECGPEAWVLPQVLHQRHLVHHGASAAVHQDGVLERDEERMEAHSYGLRKRRI